MASVAVWLSPHYCQTISVFSAFLNWSNEGNIVIDGSRLFQTFAAATGKTPIVLVLLIVTFYIRPFLEYALCVWAHIGQIKQVECDVNNVNVNVYTAQQIAAYWLIQRHILHTGYSSLKACQFEDFQMRFYKRLLHGLIIKQGCCTSAL